MSRERQLPGTWFELAALAIALAGTCLVIARGRARRVEGELRLELAASEFGRTVALAEVQMLNFELDGPIQEDPAKNGPTGAAETGRATLPKGNGHAEPAPTERRPE